MSRSHRQSLGDSMHNQERKSHTPGRVNRQTSQATDRSKKENAQIYALNDRSASAREGYHTLSTHQQSNSSSEPLAPPDPLCRERSASDHAFGENFQPQPELSQADLLQKARATIEKEAKAREEYSATTENFKYGKLQEAGLLRLRWIEDAGVSDCPIAKSTLTFDAFHQMLPTGEVQVETLPLNLEEHIVGLGLPNEFYTLVKESAYRAFDYMSKSGVMQWVGRTGPGVIFLEVVGSQEGYPHISDITLACYKRDFPIDRLKYIFVCTVIQPETLHFVRRRLYPAHSIPWPNEKPQTWAFGTPEYEALLGTRIGKMVAYIVLGGFERGTRRIGQIRTWSTAQGFVNLRFDIKSTEKEHRKDKLGRLLRFGSSHQIETR
ncbi:hypothetical protein N7523_001217 [Penicillium sp. IBT 18751x]|nr:hypothetical protein N7523_001217 [Penicillium sp. IBT 18751x]